MTYFKELLANWRPLLSTMIGLSTGFTALAVTNSIMGPYLIHAFGWSKSEFALLGTLGLMTFVALPMSGRLADRFGVRRTALVGVITGPLTFIAMSRMSGSFPFYLGIVVVQNLLCMTTTSAVFTRTVVQHITRARGVALAIAASGPAVTIALAGPMLNNFVAHHGWRNGYLVLALFMTVGGLISIALVPPREDVPIGPLVARHRSEPVYGVLFRMPIFWIMFGAIVCTNVAQFMVNSQLGVLLQANGISAHAISPILSVLAIGILIGRFACGIALDRFPAGIVAMIALGLPAIGQFLIASSYDSPGVLTFAVLMLGLSYGAEGDLIGYMVARNFGIRVYGTVLGIMAASISLGSAIGSVLLSATLKSTGGYALFLTISGTVTLAGSLLFLLLPRRAPQDDHGDDGSIARADGKPRLAEI
jgi:predicted MFS family arabinose efflux permease